MRSRRGLTLVELAMVLAIIGILMTITVASLGAMKSRTSFNASANQVLSEVKRTRIEAFNRGTYTVFVIDTNTQNWYGVQTNTQINNTASLQTWLTSFAASPTTCTTAPTCLTFTKGQLPGSPTASFAGTYAGLPAPFNGIASSSACSFCMTTSPTGWGAIAFSPGGAVVFSVNPGGQGAQFTLTSTRDTVASSPKLKTIAVVARNGLIEAFDKP